MRAAWVKASDVIEHAISIAKGPSDLILHMIANLHFWCEVIRGHHVDVVGKAVLGNHWVELVRNGTAER